MGVEEEELLARIRALEGGQAELRREVSELHQLPPERHRPARPPQHLWPPSWRIQRRAAAGLSLRHHVLIMQSLGQALHVLDVKGKVLYWLVIFFSSTVLITHVARNIHDAEQLCSPVWLRASRNRQAEQLYGYSASEAVGLEITKLIINPWDVRALNSIIGNIFKGKCWRGKFPARNKPGNTFPVVVDATPLYDDDGSLVGLVCLSEDVRALEEIVAAGPNTSGSCTFQ